MKGLENKVIIVAGAAGGIGSAIARELAGQGAVVVAACRSTAKIRVLLGEIRKYSPQSRAFRGDLSKAATWARLVDAVTRTYQRVDGLVNCVGVLSPKNFEDLDHAEIASSIDANLLSVVLGTQAVLPAMRRQHAGHIITVGSLGGVVPMPYASLYCASKYAVRGFSLSMSEELRGTGIDVSLLSAGPVRTKMLEAEARNDRSVIAFINKPVLPTNVADAVASLFEHPRREQLYPLATGVFSLLCSFTPAVFAAAYRLLHGLGRIRLQAYRKEVSAMTPVLSIEH